MSKQQRLTSKSLSHMSGIKFKSTKSVHSTRNLGTLPFPHTMRTPQAETLAETNAENKIHQSTLMKMDIKCWSVNMQHQVSAKAFFKTTLATYGPLSDNIAQIQMLSTHFLLYIFFGGSESNSSWRLAMTSSGTSPGFCLTFPSGKGMFASSHLVHIQL